MRSSYDQAKEWQLSAPALHVIAILSHGTHFPPGSERPQIEAACHCKVFYFYKTGTDIGGRDDLESMLTPLSPKLLKFSNPQQFRERLLEFSEAVKKAAAEN